MPLSASIITPQKEAAGAASNYVDNNLIARYCFAGGATVPDGDDCGTPGIGGIGGIGAGVAAVDDAGAAAGEADDVADADAAESDGIFTVPFGTDESELAAGDAGGIGVGIGAGGGTGAAGGFGKLEFCIVDVDNVAGMPESMRAPDCAPA